MNNVTPQKKIAIAFLQNAATGKLDEAYELVSPGFRHHNAYFPGDAESLKAISLQFILVFSTHRTKLRSQSCTSSDLKATKLLSCGTSGWKCRRIRRTKMEPSRCQKPDREGGHSRETYLH